MNLIADFQGGDEDPYDARLLGPKPAVGVFFPNLLTGRSILTLPTMISLLSFNTQIQEDVVAADIILWVGISFEQSASTTYFRKVRSFLNDEDHAGECGA